MAIEERERGARLRSPPERFPLRRRSGVAAGRSSPRGAGGPRGGRGGETENLCGPVGNLGVERAAGRGGAQGPHGGAGRAKRAGGGWSIGLRSAPKEGDEEAMSWLDALLVVLRSACRKTEADAVSSKAS